METRPCVYGCWWNKLPEADPTFGVIGTPLPIDPKLTCLTAVSIDFTCLTAVSIDFMQMSLAFGKNERHAMHTCTIHTRFQLTH